MKITIGRFLLLTTAIAALAGCPGKTKNEMWQEVNGSSIINFLDDSNVYFLSEAKNINNPGKYSSNNVYTDRNIFSYTIDGNILMLNSDKGRTAVFKKLPPQNTNTAIVGEWVGKEDNYLFLKNGMGYYFNNEKFILAKIGRCVAYSENKIFDIKFGECPYSIDKDSLRISVNGNEKEYVKKSTQKTADIAGFWKSKNDEDFYYYFSNNGLVAENYFHAGSLIPSVYYNGTIYSFQGKTNYNLKGNELTAHLKDYIGLNLEKSDVVVELIKAPNTGISGKWKNSIDPVYGDEIEFFEDGIALFKDTKNKTYFDFIYNNGNIYNTHLMGEGKLLFYYTLANDEITLKKINTSYDITTKKFTETIDSKEYKYTK